MTWMVKNSAGKPDAMLTAAVLSLATVLVKVVLNGSTFKGYQFGSIDSGLVAALLTPTLGAYVARRYTDANAGTP